MGDIDIRKILAEQASEVETKRALEILTQQETERDPGGTDMKDLAKENLRLSIENRQLKKKLAKLEREYLELARREAVRGGATGGRMDQALPPNQT